MAGGGPYSILTIFIAIVIASVLPKVFWKQNSMTRCWKIFERWSKKHGFRMEKRDPDFENPDAPTTKGKLHHLETEILVVPKYKAGIWTVVRVFSSVESNFYFSIGVDSFTDEVIKTMKLDEFDSGNELFDDEFRVKSNDKLVMQNLLDQRTINNFLNNQFLFEHHGLVFQSGILRYARQSMIQTEEEMDNAFELAQFMAELVSDLDKILCDRN